MTEQPLCIEWTWMLTSELHCGSGLSRPGRADSLIYRNAQGDVEISGDAVKGALRMSAEELFAWLGQAQAHDYQKQKTSDPRHPLLEAVFGEQARTRFFPAQIQDAGQARLQIRAATALNPETGVAQDNTLRQVELLSSGVAFQSRCYLWQADDKLLTLLLAALTATEQIGGKGATGWGRMQLSRLTLSNGKSAAGYLTAEKLTDLQHQLKTLASASQTLPDASPIGASSKPYSASAWQWYQLNLTLYEPTCVSLGPSSGHQLSSGQLIPASALRGALMKSWQRQGAAAEHYLCWLGEQSHWLPAVPAYGAKTAQGAIMAPRSFIQPKQTGGSETLQVHDLLCGEVEQAEPQAATQIKWQGLGQTWLQQDCQQTCTLPRETTLHVARDYQTRSKRAGALFSREWLAASEQAPLKLVAFARLPVVTSDKELDHKAFEIYLGRRSSAGHGRASVAFEALASAPYTSLVPEGTELYIQLLTPLLYRGKYGYFQGALDQAAWQEILQQVSLVSCQSFSASETATGWMRQWGHNTTPRKAVAAGTVWHLRFADPQTATQAYDCLSRLHDTGLGEQTHLGYGAFVVNPPWLAKHALKAEDLTRQALVPQPQSEQKPQPWPGLEELSRERLEALISALPETVPGSLRGPLQSLAALARSADAQAQSVLATCHKMATRTNQSRWSPAQKTKAKDRKQNAFDRSGAWDKLKTGSACETYLSNAISGLSDEKQKLLSLRFALEALLIRAEKEAIQ